LGAAKNIAMRSRWLAKRLWMVMAAEVALTAYRHWTRLSAKERSRLFELARRSKGRPSKNLSGRERREADRLLDKLGHLELAGSVAGTVLPFRPLSRFATKLAVDRRERRR
jgi:hypothetical protein